MTAWFDEDEVIRPLDTFATLPPWLAAAMDPDRVADSLERHVPELREKRPQLLACRPERLRAKGAEWLARYRLSVAQPGGDVAEVVVVGNLWGPSTEALPAEAKAGAGFGEEGWRCLLPDLRLELRVEERDPALPALQQIVDPAAAAVLLQDVLRDAGYADVVVGSCDPQVVRYKPGSRCTVVVRLRYDRTGASTPPDPVVIKTHQGDKGRTAWAAMTALWDTPLARDGVLTLAEPLAYLPEDRILVQGPVPEELTLKELARQAISAGSAEALDGLRDELAKTGRALAALHRSGASYGSVATLDDELAEVSEVIGRLALSAPALEQAAQPLLGRLHALADEIPAEAPVPAHHDFRPAQVLLHAGGIGFIDFDGASMAEPALDLGRFRAKLRDIGISALAASGQPLAGQALAENLTLLDGLCDSFLDAYQAAAPVSRDRVLLWETSDLLTALLHAWTKVRVARVHPRLAVLLYHLRSAGGTPPQNLEDLGARLPVG